METIRIRIKIKGIPPQSSPVLRAREEAKPRTKPRMLFGYRLPATGYRLPATIPHLPPAKGSILSINSKVRREAKKRSAAKSQGKQPAGAPIEPHAELRDQQGSLLAGVVRRDGEWVLGMGGRIAGNSESAAHVLAMIQHAARLHEQAGTPVRLKFSDALRDAAHEEASALGMGFDEFATALQQKMQAATTKE